MKRIVGTLVLFILLIATVALLTQIDGKTNTVLQANTWASNTPQ